MALRGPLRPTEVLIVEDNEGDIALAKLALEESGVSNNIHVVRNGVEALSYLGKVPPYQDAIRPDLILMDLNMPRMNGHETLEAIRSEIDFRTIPIIMMTVSKAEVDVMQSYRLRANCYIVKPANLDDFADVIRNIQRFWFSVASLPALSNI